MENIIKVRFVGIVNTVKCVLGFHHFGVTEELGSIVNKNYTCLEYKHKCHHCHREETVIESYSPWDGEQHDVIEIGYVGDYSLRKLARGALVKLNGVFGNLT